MKVPSTCAELSSLLGRVVDETTEEFAPQIPEDAELVGIICRWRLNTDGEILVVGIAPASNSASYIAEVRAGKSRRFAGEFPPYSVMPIPQVDKLGGVAMKNDHHSSDDDDVSFDVVMSRVDFGVVGPSDKAIEVAAKIAESLQ